MKIDDKISDQDRRPTRACKTPMYNGPPRPAAAAAAAARRAMDKRSLITSVNARRGTATIAARDRSTGACPPGRRRPPLIFIYKIGRQQKSSYRAGKIDEIYKYILTTGRTGSTEQVNGRCNTTVNDDRVYAHLAYIDKSHFRRSGRQARRFEDQRWRL